MLVRQVRPTKSVVLAPPANRFDSAVRAELLEDLTLEFVDPPVSYAHSRRDLLVWDSFSQILHEFVLPIRQGPATQTTMPGTFATGWWLRDLGLGMWDAE